MVRWPLVVIGCWVALAAVLTLTFPPLAQVVRESPVAVLPANAPSAVTTRQMTEAFHESGSQNLLLAVLTDEKGLGPADEDVYRTLVNRLRQDTRDVVMLQDFLSAPPLRDTLTSKDHRAWFLPIGLAGQLGSPKVYGEFTRVADIIKQTLKQTQAGSALTGHLTGPAATLADVTDVGLRDMHRIEIAIVLMVLVILLIVYRNPVTMLLPLITIGISLVTAQGVVAGFSQLGLGISNQIIVLMSGMMAGAGIDYAVFLISRYHDYVRLGADSNQAVKKALSSIGKVIAASAATVAITFLGMVFTKLGIFSSVGPAMAIAIAVAFLAAVTLLPAIMVLAGPRGWIRPRRELTTRFWRRSGIRIVRRPAAHLVASLIVLAVLAGCVSLARYNYDDRKTLPDSVESAVGYAEINRHFPLNSAIPEYLFIQSPHDLRTPQGLADLEQMAQRVSQLPGIAAVRGITRPTGESLEQARLTFQVGEVGNRLQDVSRKLTDQTGDLDKLSNGAAAMATALSDIRGKVGQAMSTVRSLVDSLTSIQNQFGANTTFKDVTSEANLIVSMRALGAIGVSLANAGDAYNWVGPVVAALDANPTCDASPSCTDSRAQLQTLATARANGTLDKIANLGQKLLSMKQTQSVEETSQTVESTMKGLHDALDKADSALKSLGIDDPAGAGPRLDSMQQGADTVADGARRLAGGVQELVDQAKKVGAGLTDASAFLRTMKFDAGTPAMAGFYIPPQVLTQDEFKKAAAVFMSPDGHAVRYLIQTKLNPFSTAAMDQLNVITNTARGAQPNTTLADASISIAGHSATLRDVRGYYNHDIRFIIAVTLVVVLLILIALLRAIVAPLYLIVSVVISYLSALGIGVIVFQLILGHELSWSVPGLAFIVLVAVGADYNMLLISRIRDESPDGVRSGVIRTVGSTGAVITSAGLIFAASMFGLLFASISSMVQMGFVIGIGLLLDTFVVRTITVPAMAVLVGRGNWWPSRLRPRPHSPGGRAPWVRERQAGSAKSLPASGRHALREPSTPAAAPSSDDDAGVKAWSPVNQRITAG